MTNILLYVFAKDTISNKPLVVKSVWLANDATHTNALSVVAGTHRLVWGAGSDNPGLVPEAVSVKVSASLESALYLVVDLSGGADAESYPISYLNAVPEGGWTDEHKTTKLVLRRIQPGTFTMGQRSTDVPGWSDSGLHEVTISHPFYIGVFEVTQKQYELVTGSNPSKYKGDARPVECVSCDMIRGEFSTYHWPMSKNVDPSSFMGRLRSKTTLNGFDLPTESQWEYACRAGTTTGLNNGKNLTNNGSGTDPQLNEVGRYWYNRSDGRGGYSDAHANVGSYQPNAWGLYDMHGNVWERCLDLYGSYPNKAVTDPKGASSGTNVVTRGGGYWDYAYRCASSNRGYDSSSYYLSDSGFRLCCRYGVATESPDVSRDIVFASPSLGNGLVGYWRFDGNANDSSGNGNDGVIQGVKLTEDRHGNANSAYYFDGTSHIEVPNSSSLNGVGKTVTCSVWMKPESGAWVDSQGEEWMAILCKGTSIPRNIGFQLSKKLGLELVSDTHWSTGDYGAYLVLPTLPVLNEWQMLTYTSDGVTAKYYVNGMCIASTNCTIEAKTNVDPLLIGKDPPGDLEYFKGAMDEVRIYNRALSDDEVHDLYVLDSDERAVVQIQSPDVGGIPKAKVLHGDPVCLSYSFQDTWGIETVTTTCVNRVKLAREPSGDIVGTFDDRVESFGAGETTSRIGLELPIWQALDCGSYRLTVELNADLALAETTYANNTNAVMLTVVPSTEVTFVSEGDTVAVRKYGIGEAYGKFPATPVRSGFRFIGWFTEEVDGDVVTTSSKVPSSPATLYAHWEVVISQTLPVGGTLSAGTTTWTRGNLYKVTSNITVPSGATLTIEPGVTVKFAEGKSLTVNRGGTLSAIGTRALPIVFTSIKDDSNGGDTNGDGSATVPQPGDWEKIGVNGGTATFDCAKILYSSRNATTGAINMTNNGGTVTFNNGEIAHCAYDAVGVEDGHCYVRNTVIHDSLLAFRHWTKDPIENCVIYDCGRLTQGGGQKFYNCIFSHITETWEAFSFPNNGTTYRNCCFWNEGGSVLTAEGRQDAKKVCGKNGNIWANPLLVNPENGDFRIAANSPCVDAGNGAYAPEKDYYGQPRMNVDAIRPKGSVAANGAVPDIGIYEVPGDGKIPSADLTVTAVTVSEALTVGKEVEVSWVVKNVGEEPASGSWRDEVEIVAANGQLFSMGTFTISAEIRPGATANFRAAVKVPAAQEGAVQVRVTANKYQDLFEAMKSENNAGIAAATLAVPTLAVPADGTATTITLGGDSDYGFKLATSATLPSQGGVLVIRGAGELDAWLGNGSIAAKDNAIRTAVQIADGTWLLQIPAGSEPRVTVRNDGEDAVATSLSIEVGAFFLLDTGKMSAANSGMVTVPFTGNGFDETITCWLERGGTRIEIADLTVANGVFATATFDVTGCAAGDWTLHVKKGTDESFATLLTLTESQIGPKWYKKVNIANVVRKGRVYVGSVEYGNTGDVAIEAPYLILTATNSTLIRLTEADAWTETIELMAISDSNPASLLKGGESRKIQFFYKTFGSRAKVVCNATHQSSEVFPWDTNAAYMRPSWASDEMWGLALATLKASVGAKWDDFLGRMRANADHLMKLGYRTERLDRLWQMVINEALGSDNAIQTLAGGTDLARSGRGLGLSFSRTYGAAMFKRLKKGVLGYGWTDNYSTYAELVDQTTLAFHLPSGATYQFHKVNGKWTPEDARDKTVLAETTSAYTLTYKSGTVQAIAKSNMRTSSIRDNQGNVLTFTYSGSQLQKVQHSDGQTLTFTYSGNKITSVTDDQGRTVTYGYTGDFLTSVTAFNGLVTRYVYHAADSTPLSRALTQIVYPDGTTKDYTYDDQGRVATASVNGNQFTTEIVRGACGAYSAIAPNGGVTEVTVGARGETLKTVNALGQVVEQKYTTDTLLESVIAPSGKRNKITYNTDGAPVASLSASGATTAFSYEPEFDNLASVTDAKGHAISYGYDNKGRGNSISYVDGSMSSLEYNEKGDVARATNRRGQTIKYEYDAEGNLVKKTWPHGRTFTLAYDAKGNVTNASDSVTGAVTMEYDANERLTRIVYPKGRGFTYTYDAVGRVTERTMLGGSPSSATATQRYTYDSFGRLSRVTDGDGNPYITNAYDPTTGWLLTQTYGNGTVVSNAYDILGRTVGIYHSRTGGSPVQNGNAPAARSTIAFFEYAYDADGKCISQTTAEGTESYTYDADGQLTSVTYPDGTSETFTYDAVGNRISRTGDSPVQNESYTVNNLNQYTEIVNAQAARSTMTYDLDGNLTSRTDADGTTTYTYDTLNRLIAVTNDAKNIHWSCEYDVFGNRVSVTDNGTTTERLFVQGSLPSVAAEYQGNTLKKCYVLVGAVRLADISGTGGSPVQNTRYYHSDLLGSARLLTDGSGATKGTRSFKAFGETRVSTGETTDAGYVGTLGVETDLTGLLFMRNRYYDVGMGRFMQMDPIGLNAGDVNVYRYCGNEVCTKYDLEGLDGNNPLYGYSGFTYAGCTPMGHTTNAEGLFRNCMGSEDTIVDPRNKVANFFENYLPSFAVFSGFHDKATPKGWKNMPMGTGWAVNLGLMPPCYGGAVIANWTATARVEYRDDPGNTGRKDGRIIGDIWRIPFNALK